MQQILTARASIQITKPIAVVFEAIVDPMKMAQYFIAKSTGRIESHKTVHWKFPEFDDLFPVTGKTIQAHDYISFDWSGGSAGMLVEIFLEYVSENNTVVRVKEGGWLDDEQGTQHAIGQTEGWANFLACLKAYLEYGINLRQGAFEFMRHG